MKKVLFSAIDVDDQAYHVSIFDETDGKQRSFSCKPSVSALESKLRDLVELDSLKICYEASYIGYSLQRQLKSRGISCEIIAPSLIPQLPGKKIKTDRIDSEKLAKLYAKGLLTTIYLPCEEDEADRGLLRTQSFLSQEVVRIKNHILSICKCQGWNFQEETKFISHWTKSHHDWLASKISKEAPFSRNLELECCLRQLKFTEDNLSELEGRIEELSKTEKYAAKAHRLKCFRGLSTISSMRLLTELGDIRRFSNPNQLSSYAGLDIREHSSGGREVKQGITKMGNGHIRRTVVEASQFALSVPKVSRDLRRRREGATTESIAIADRCMARLHKKGCRLLFRGKARNKVKVACAREMLSFIWETLTKECA